MHTSTNLFKLECSATMRMLAALNENVKTTVIIIFSTMQRIAELGVTRYNCNALRNILLFK